MKIEHLSPTDGSLVFEYLETEIESLPELVNISREAFNHWKGVSHYARAAYLRTVIKNLELRREEIAQIVRLETGKPIKVSLGEVNAAIEFGYLLSAHAMGVSSKIVSSSHSNRNIQIDQAPFGVAALIMSYNTPFPNYAWKAFPALLAGNTIILKPSTYTCKSAELFCEILIESGFPPGVVSIVYGGREVGAALLNQKIDLISFTGSTMVGKEINQNASGNLTKVVLELGGANPFILLEDCDLYDAIPHIFESAFSNAGQRCAAGSRLIIHESLVDEFMEKFKSYSNKKSIGLNENVDVGPIISINARNKFEDYLKECILEGAKVIRIGTIVQQSECTVQPALIRGLNPNSNLSLKEIFAPGIRVYVFDSESQAVELANTSNYGLTAAVWSRNLSTAKRVASQVVCGVVNINGPTHGAEPVMPFGGFKDSGNGTREAGIESLFEYSNIRVTSTFID
jgi:aldehyde dehydrogenase (NAD+)